jgi:hypothetical protein
MAVYDQIAQWYEKEFLPASDVGDPIGIRRALTDPAAVVIRPGYRDGYWTKDSWTENGVRNRVGATHLPLAGLLGSFLKAGLRFTEFVEGGAPTPTTLSIRAVRS